MIRKINHNIKAQNFNQLEYQSFIYDFHNRFINLLSLSFSYFNLKLVLSFILSIDQLQTPHLCGVVVRLLHKKQIMKEISSHIFNFKHLNLFFSSYDLNRLQTYSRNLADYHLILDLIPSIAKFYYTFIYYNEQTYMPLIHHQDIIKLSYIQHAILIGLGLQHKTISQLVKELNLSSQQLLALFNKSIRKFSKYFDKIYKDYLKNKLKEQETIPIHNDNNKDDEDNVVNQTSMRGGDDQHPLVRGNKLIMRGTENGHQKKEEEEEEEEEEEISKIKKKKKKKKKEKKPQEEEENLMSELQTQGKNLLKEKQNQLMEKLAQYAIPSDFQQKKVTINQKDSISIENKEKKDHFEIQSQKKS